MATKRLKAFLIFGLFFWVIFVLRWFDVRMYAYNSDGVPSVYTVYIMHLIVSDVLFRTKENLKLCHLIFPEKNIQKQHIRQKLEATRGKLQCNTPKTTIYDHFYPHRHIALLSILQTCTIQTSRNDKEYRVKDPCPRRPGRSNSSLFVLSFFSP